MRRADGLAAASVESGSWGLEVSWFKRRRARHALGAISLLCAVAFGIAGSPGATSTTPPLVRPMLGNPRVRSPRTCLLGTSRISGLGRLLGPDQPHRRQVRCRRARLRDREARPAESLRQPGRHDAHGGRRSPLRGRRLLGPRPAGDCARPELRDERVRVSPLHLRRTAGADGAGLERRLPDSAGAEHRRVRRQRPTRPDPGRLPTTARSERRRA